MMTIVVHRVQVSLSHGPGGTGMARRWFNPSTFPSENVELRRTITPGCLLVSDQKFSEQLHCLKIFKTKPLCDFFLERNELSLVITASH